LSRETLVSEGMQWVSFLVFTRIIHSNA
jgi:hypothetical protein